MEINFDGTGKRGSGQKYGTLIRIIYIIYLWEISFTEVHHVYSHKFLQKWYDIINFNLTEKLVENQNTQECELRGKCKITVILITFLWYKG